MGPDMLRGGITFESLLYTIINWFSHVIYQTPLLQDIDGMDGNS